MRDANCDGLILLDRDRSASLWDVGAPGYLAAVGVDPDGEDVLWLVSEEHLGVKDAPHGNPDQRHERVGPLNEDLRYRIWNHQCAALTRRGPRCRNWVPKSSGPLCLAHAAEAEAEAVSQGQRCRHPTSTGEPCTRPVREPGRKCAYHVKHAATGDRAPNADAGPGAP